MRLALAQVNPTVGDLRRNAAIIAHAIANARQCDADLVVFPELALVGYPPRDLLLQEGFIAATLREAERLGRECSQGLTVVIGLPLHAPSTHATESGDPLQAGITNSLLVYRDGQHIARYDKQLLPTYDVFDEDRYFVEGRTPVVIDVPSRNGTSMRVGLTICEDLWRGEDVGFSHHYTHHADPVAELAKLGVDLIINPSASPFVLGKGKRHRALLAGHARTHNIVVAAVNQLGGNDELIFDGSAAVFDPRGTLIAAGRAFAEDLVVVDLPAASGAQQTAASVHDPLVETSDEALLFSALVLGVRDYCRKTGFKDVVLGLSGGIDSAVTAVLAAAALGAERVLGAAMPSRYSSQGSKDDAYDLAQRLGMRCIRLPIEEAFVAYQHTLHDYFTSNPRPKNAGDVTEENLQSRIRGTLLMALSNKFGSLLLTTGNKSELAVGYCTLYGDMNGGLAVLSDVGKVWVYRLARWMNDNFASLGIPLARPPIPEATITKPPSAELRPNQTDQDSLPPYEVLDEIIRRHVELRQSVSTIIRETNFDVETVRRMTKLIDRSEFKRKQAATGLKVTGVAFGSGRRWPIAQGWLP